MNHMHGGKFLLMNMLRGELLEEAGATGTLCPGARRRERRKLFSIWGPLKDAIKHLKERAAAGPRRGE